MAEERTIPQQNLFSQRWDLVVLADEDGPVPDRHDVPRPEARFDGGLDGIRRAK